MEINVAMQKVLKLIEAVVANNELENIEIEDSFFWSIPVAELLVGTDHKKPEITIGQASECLELIEGALRDGFYESYALVWEAEMLMLVANSRNRS